MESLEAKPKHGEWFYLARDVGIAILLVGGGLGAVFMYTQNWPPMVVIESSSMQHSDTESYVGVIDTGDLVLVQKAATKSDVQTWVEGRNTGYQTYGDYGDVLIFHRTSSAPGRFDPDPPIIHRAIIYLEWNEGMGGYDVPALAGAGNAGKWSCIGCNATTAPLGMLGTLRLLETSPQHNRAMDLDLNGIRGTSANWNPTREPYSGFVTMGDHNGAHDRGLWPQESIVGKARGEIPWFGLIKLSIPGLNDRTSCCEYVGCIYPDCFATRNSWDALVITIVVALSLPVFLDLVLGWRERRKKTAMPVPAQDGPPETPKGEPGD